MTTVDLQRFFSFCSPEFLWNLSPVEMRRLETERAPSQFSSLQLRYRRSLFSTYVKGCNYALERDRNAGNLSGVRQVLELANAGSGRSTASKRSSCTRLTMESVQRM